MTCPGNPPPPDGYRVWRGSVPPELVQWAIDLRDHIRSFPYGTVWTMSYGGQTVVARKDYHTWTYKGGQLLQGICIPGITLYEPIPPAVGASTPIGDPAMFGAPDDNGWWIAALAVGALAAWAIKRRS